MTDGDWQAATYPSELLRAARGRVSHRKLRLLAAACCRRLLDGLDRAGRRRIDRAEDYADGRVPERHFLAGLGQWVFPARPQTFRGVSQIATWSLGWPDAEQPNRDFNEATGELVQRPWQPGEYAEHFTLRVLLHAAHATARRVERDGFRAEMDRESAAQAELVRCIVPNPARPAAFDPGWRTEPAVALARRVYESRDFSLMPILADALDDAGCTDAELLAHGRGPGPHARGCRAVDLVLGLD